MKYFSVQYFSEKWDRPARTVRHYCATGKIKGAYISGKTWNIPFSAILPKDLSSKSIIRNFLLNALQEQKQMKLKGGIYHRTQIDLTFNSNRIEGSKLTSDQTRYIFETNTIGLGKAQVLNIDDIIETNNHFRCIDLVIQKASWSLTESLIKQIHFLLKNGTSDSRKDWFAVGDYKTLPNEVGGNETCEPSLVSKKMKILIAKYKKLPKKSLTDILDFHHKFEMIHPFQDGNGRVGRLILFKECLAHNIVPFILTEELKLFYYRGLNEWDEVKEYLTDTCLTAQDNYKLLLEYFKIPYN